MGLYKRKGSQVWQADVTVGTGDEARRCRMSTGHTDKGEAQEVEAWIRAEMYAGRNPKAKTSQSPAKRELKEVTLGQALDRALGEMWADHRSYASYYLPTCKSIRAYLGADTPLSSISDASIRAMVSYWREPGRDIKKSKKGANSRSTVNRKLNVLRVMMARAGSSWGYKVKPIAWSHLRQKDAENARIVWIDDELEAKLLDILRSPETPGYYKDAADCFAVDADVGLRISALLHLPTSKIDFKKRRLLVDILEEKHTNKTRQQQTIPLTGRAFSILYARKDRAKPFEGLTYQQARRAFDYARSKLGIPSKSGISIHALRHSCATRLLESGVDIRVVQRWLGHADIRTTMRYAKVSEKTLDAARDALEYRSASHSTAHPDCDVKL